MADLQTELYSQIEAYKRNWDKALVLISKVLPPQTHLHAKPSSLSEAHDLLVQGLFIRFCAEWERFFRQALNYYFEEVRHFVNQHPDPQELVLQESLLLHLLRSHQQAFSQNNFSETRIQTMLQKLRELSVRPLGSALQAEEKFGTLDIKLLNQHLYLLGFYEPVFNLNLLKFLDPDEPPIEDNPWKEFIGKRHDCAHGKPVQIGYSDLKRLIAILIALADQLISALAAAFTNPKFIKPPTPGYQ